MFSHTKKPVVNVLLDFDGTLTQAPGSKTVYSQLYQSLFENQLTLIDYTKDAFLRSENIKHDEIPSYSALVKILNTGYLLPENVCLKLIPEAKVFIEECLSSKDFDVNMAIISRNRAEYIKAALLAGGLKHSLVTRIQIYDIKMMCDKNRDKKEFAYDYQRSHPSIYTIILDDTWQDAQSMRAGVKEAGQENVSTLNQQPGNFDFQYAKNMIDERIKLKCDTEIDIVNFKP